MILNDNVVTDINENNNIIIEEIHPSEVTENDQTSKTEVEDEIAIISEEDSENSSTVNKKEIIEPIKETLQIILDKNLINDNIQITIDIDDIKIKNDEKLEEPSLPEIKKEKKVDITKIDNEPPKQAFKGTKKRNPKYWKFDPDEEPENSAPVVKPKPKRNLKYWKIDPDEILLEETPKPVDIPKIRNPKYWKIDPEEEKLYIQAEANKKEENIKPVKSKKNPKYWKFDPDEEETKESDETNELKLIVTNENTLEQGTKEVFKGTKKRNPKYWKFDPDEFVTQDKINKEPETKKKRNPKYWKFDPDEDLDKLEKPIIIEKNAEKVEKKSKYWNIDESVKDTVVDTKIIADKEEEKPKKNKYWKIEEPTDDIKIIEKIEDVIPKISQDKKPEQVDNIVPKQEKSTTKKNKYWKTEETEKPKEEVKEDDDTKKKNKYWKTDEKSVDPIQEKIIETQKDMYWKLDDEVKSSNLKKPIKDKTTKTKTGKIYIYIYTI